MSILATTATDHVDDGLVLYQEWREVADAGAAAYAKWCTSPAAHRRRRFAAYLAALDQEENAARAYARAITQLDRRITLPRDLR